MTPAPAPPSLSPSTEDVTAGRYTPRARWSPAQHAAHAAALAALAGPLPRRRRTVPPPQLRPVRIR